MAELPDPREGRIVFVDDEPANLALLDSILRTAGYFDLVACESPAEAWRSIEAHEPDLLLTDLHMPQQGGLAFIRDLRGQVPEAEAFPIVVVTADLTAEAEKEALALGASDFVTKPFQAHQIELRVRNLLRTHFLYRALREHAANLEDIVRERTLELEKAHLDLLKRLARAAEFRDYVTGRHTQRVGAFASLLARRLGRPPSEVELIGRAAPLHDVGKIGIPDRILLKPSSLSEDEFEAMKNHVDVGADLLGQGTSELLEMARHIAMTHHERWDGSGYPRGLVGDEIPLVGQIVAIADVFDTLINERPYKPAWPVEKAIAEIRRQSGKWFAPRLVEAFLAVLAENPELLVEGADAEVEAAWTGLETLKGA